MSEEIIFENTANRTEVTKWYTIKGVPIMEISVGGRCDPRRLLPTSVRFTFVDGDPASLRISAKSILPNGEPEKRGTEVPDIHMWDQKKWPSWLHDAYQLACSDFQEGNQS